MRGFRAIGLSYKNTELSLREKVSFEHGRMASEFLLKMKELFDIEEGLIVSTCNRTEVYYTASKDLTDDIVKLISSIKGLKPAEIASHFSLMDTEEAINHLFRVSLGLESKVLGDIQISNQIKRAYQTSTDLNLAGPFLHRLMHTIFFANKRVVQETRLQDGTASVASVGVDVVESFIQRIETPKIALIGLGEIGQYVLENLKSEKAEITLVNRTHAKAAALASKLNASVIDFKDLESVIQGSDVVISAVAVEKPIIHAKHFKTEETHKLLIDLSLPRSIDSDIDKIPGLSLYNVDQLGERTLKAKEIREASIPDVEQIINESLNNFTSWKNEMEVSPAIKKLKNALDTIRKEELARHAKISREERKLLEIVTKNMMQKVIKLPVLQLKAACKRGEAETLVGVLNDLFNLEQGIAENK